MNRLLFLIKKIIPQKVFLRLQPVYHWLINGGAALFYGFPSEKMLVIGITGTTGKTTATYFLAHILREAGYKVGYTSTMLLSDGKSDWLNNQKMTMLGRFFTQKMLSRMAKNRCQIAIIETTSEGIKQFRHRFINYDLLVFTGLYPEHIESHGSFEKYKQAKLELFQHLEKRCPSKKLSFKPKILKTILVNGDDEHFRDFLNFSVDRKVVLRKSSEASLTQKNNSDCFYTPLVSKNGGNPPQFIFNQTPIQLQVLGDFNVLNASLAACAAKTLDVAESVIKNGLEKIKSMPGRLEKIEEGQDFTVIVDYAFEPKALQALYGTLEKMEFRHIIHVLGATGGGRDKKRRPILGKIAGRNADQVIVTNEDPYDEDPQKIMQAVAQGGLAAGKIKEENLFLISDRRRAIQKAFSLARKNDLVLITGKGSEQAICVERGKKIPWDDRKVAREELVKILKQK